MEYPELFLKASPKTCLEEYLSGFLNECLNDFPAEGYSKHISGWIPTEISGGIFERI